MSEILKNQRNQETKTNEQLFKLLVESATLLPELARGIHNIEKIISWLKGEATDILSDEDCSTVKPKIESFKLKKTIMLKRFAELLNIDKNNSDQLITSLLLYESQFRSD